ncbi:MAG: hypothetical protein ACFB10_20035 [Salibacteraceae bacterium]
MNHQQKVLVSNSSGYISLCPHCNTAVIAFGTMLTTLPFSQLSTVKTSVEETLECIPRFDCPKAKQFTIRLRPDDLCCMVLNLRELEGLDSMIAQALLIHTAQSWLENAEQ